MDIEIPMVQLIYEVAATSLSQSAVLILLHLVADTAEKNEAYQIYKNHSSYTTTN